MSGVLIMAKAPRAGEVKTRLEPLLGPAGCAALQRELIRHTASWATAVATRVWLAYAPADAEEELAGLVPEAVRLFAQEDGDLGRRLRAAVDVVGGEDRGPLAILGTDAPLLGPEQVRGAWRALTDGGDACLAPALDGGYSLIALARPTRSAFVLPSPEWGGPRVLELTIAQLPPVGDLDPPTDAAALLADPLCPPSIRAALAVPEAA